jgi:CRP/FNR family transcriptional regulator, cyclic AMP receptor protein
MGNTDAMALAPPTRSSRTAFGVVALPDEDPDLFWAVEGHLADEVRSAARAHVLTWETDEAVAPPPAATAPGAYGMLILEGALVIRFELGRYSRAEILGEGDLTRPWVELPGDVTPTAASDWRPLKRTRLAVLDCSFSNRVAPFPQVADALMARLVLRSRRLHMQMIAASQRAIEDRLLLVLWLLAERWGIVHPEGVRVALPLTHDLLGALIGARRPSTSTAIGRLRDDGRLSADRRHGFVLHGRPPGGYALSPGAGPSPSASEPAPPSG